MQKSLTATASMIAGVLFITFLTWGWAVFVGTCLVLVVSWVSLWRAGCFVTERQLQCEAACEGMDDPVEEVQHTIARERERAYLRRQAVDEICTLRHRSIAAEESSARHYDAYVAVLRGAYNDPRFQPSEEVLLKSAYAGAALRIEAGLNRERALQEHCDAARRDARLLREESDYLQRAHASLQVWTLVSDAERRDWHYNIGIAVAAAQISNDRAVTAERRLADRLCAPSAAAETADA